MLDLNEAEPQRPQFDLDALSGALAASAEQWVPALFRHGIIDGDVLRLANIRGDKPRKNGSCAITLRGASAGSWFDFSPSVNTGGGPLSTLQHATGLEGIELLKKAAELTGGTVSAAKDRGLGKSKLLDPETEINHILAHSAEPSPDCRMGIYLKGRGLAIQDCPDLLFNSNLTDWKAKVGRPAMVAIVRNASGERIGLHRTYLAYDGTAKADMASPRKMLGEVRGGAVWLSPIGPDGVLGLSEGIETALSVMTLWAVPCWAALSARNMVDFVPPAAVRRLVIFADAGKPGQEAARALGDQCRLHGLDYEIASPRSADDFNEDLKLGLWKPGEIYQATVDLKVNTPEPAKEVVPELIAPSNPADLASAIATLTKDSDEKAINSVMRQVALARLNKIANEDALKSIRQRTGRSLPVLRDTLIAYSKEGGPDWVAAMICYENREPKPLLENCAVAFANATEWQGVIGFDDFAQSLVMRRPAPWVNMNGHFVERAWKEADDLEATRWLQKAGIHVGTLVVHEAVRLIGERARFHPVREYLDTLVWDSIPRLDAWLNYYLGCPDSDYVRAIGARYLISACARIMQPGCKVDHMLILESPEQGLGKSTALRILFQPWFADEIAELGSKDAAIQIAGKWCIEFADLHTFRRTDKNALKAFLTRVADHYVPKYGRYAIDQPRQCVFAGTCNEEVYFDDPTGARRFWPVLCSSIDLEALTRDRDTLWAEAFHRYKQGERFYLAEDDLKEAAIEQQEFRQQDDALVEPVKRYLTDTAGGMVLDISISEVLAGISIPKDRWDRSIQLRIGHALKKMGWIRFRETKRDGTKQGWRYRRPDQ